MELDAAALRAGVPCCAFLRRIIGDDQTAIRYVPESRGVYVLDAPPGTGSQLVTYCPFCSAALLPSLDGERDEVAMEAGLDPYDEEQREEFERRFGTDGWWRAALDRDPAAFLVALPRPGDILAVGARGTPVVVVAVHSLRQFESILIARIGGDSGSEPWLSRTSTRAFSQGRWPIVGRDAALAAAIGARVQWTRFGVGPSQFVWEMVDAEALGGREVDVSGEPLVVAEEGEIYSIEVERMLDAEPDTL